MEGMEVVLDWAFLKHSRLVTRGWRELLQGLPTIPWLMIIISISISHWLSQIDLLISSMRLITQGEWNSTRLCTIKALSTADAKSLHYSLDRRIYHLLDSTSAEQVLSIVVWIPRHLLVAHCYSSFDLGGFTNIEMRYNSSRIFGYSWWSH